MAGVQSLSAARVIVLATYLCSKADFTGLQALQSQRADILGLELCCRILLTFVSANEPPDRYVPLLKQLRGSDASVTDEPIDVSHVEKLSERDARQSIRSTRLEKVDVYDSEGSGSEDVVARFLVQQAFRIDAETGDLPIIRQLVEPFIEHSEFLRRWLISNLLPLLRLDYKYYPGGEGEGEGGRYSSVALEELGDLAGSAGVDLLLHKTRTADGRHFVGRALRGIVGPWMYAAGSSKRRKLVHNAREAAFDGQPSRTYTEAPKWEDLNRWIVSTSLHDYDLATKAVCQWNGPGDIDLGAFEGLARPSWEDEADSTIKYAQAALAAVFATEDSSAQATQGSWTILERAARIAEIDLGLEGQPTSSLHDYSEQSKCILAASRNELSIETLLDPSHALTSPNTDSLRFLQAILTSLQIMRDDLRSQRQLSCRSAVHQCLFSNEEEQRQDLQKLLRNFALTAPRDTNWNLARDKILWLARWRSNIGRETSKQNHRRRAMFWQLSTEELETAIFTSLLTARQYKTAIALYLGQGGPCPLPVPLVERLVEREILGAYDNASNGNRTRGGMRRASEMLHEFGPYFPPNSSTNRIENLITATHSLSFYHLTLQHGVPFKPVSIRVHQDPISLISKVLEQNPQAYTKIDDLLSIGSGIVATGLQLSTAKGMDGESSSTAELSLESNLLEVKRRIIYEAVISALSSNDFDTAYSYILTRLSSPSHSYENADDIDDLSWRAAYAAGRHRSTGSRRLASRSEQVALLAKRLDLLSLAITLVPDSTQLSSMLSTWQHCQDEINDLRTKEVAEEKAWDDKGDNVTIVPGSFGLEDRDRDAAETRRARDKRRAAVNARRRYDEDEAPMGLFEVAREAAAAFGKTAFPLGKVTDAPGVKVGEKMDVDPEGPSIAISDNAATFESAEEARERIRKRDMVSNMVTGGLVSGLGWVLGAQPVDKNSQASQDPGSGEK